MAGFSARWVIHDSKVTEYKRRIHQGMEEAGTRLMKRGVDTAREVAGERRRTGDMQAGVEGRVEALDRGAVAVTLTDKVWYSHFQDRGTARGVQPLLFLEKGLAAMTEEDLQQLAVAVGSKGLI